MMFLFLFLFVCGCFTTRFAGKGGAPEADIEFEFNPEVYWGGKGG